MIYRLVYIDDHPAYRVHEAMSWFVNHLEDKENCTPPIFDDIHVEFNGIILNHPRLLELLDSLFTAYKAIGDAETKARVISSFNYWNNIHLACHNRDEDFILWDDLGEEIR